MGSLRFKCSTLGGFLMLNSQESVGGLLYFQSTYCYVAFYVSPSIDCYSIFVEQIDNSKAYVMMDGQTVIIGAPVVKDIYPTLLWCHVR